jgi:autotransporter-associated beta strand protein
LAAISAARAQSTFQETFTGTSAYGWNFGGTGYTPTLTAATGVDSVGDGWLRLTDNGNNRSTYALLDTEIFSVNAQIQIEMDYAFYNGTGADGITFFLVDGSTTVESFAAGAYGGSLGYAQKNATAAPPAGVAGMDGGYLGFGFDNFGNYSNPTEGRVGGPGFVPNSIAVRGPEANNWSYIAGANLDSYGQMDFPTLTTRPTDVTDANQAAANFRSFRLTLDAGNYLVVEMKFGASSDYVTVFETSLASYDRPETFKVGFTGATGSSTEIHEIRNLSVVTTPNATIGDSYEWDDGKASNDDDWGSTNPTNEGNTNWFALTSGNNNKTPLIDSDIFFGSRPTNTSAGAAARPSPYASVQTVNLNQNVEVRSLNFNTKYDYQLGGPGTITLGDPSKPGTPSINVTDPIANPRFHKIDNALSVVENLAVANNSHSALTLNGAVALGSNSITTSGAGYTNLNGVITGSGAIVTTGAAPNGRDSTGIVTLKANNAATYTGTITVTGGQLVALHNNALGSTSAGTTVTSGGTLTFRGGITTAEPLTVSGAGTTLSEIANAGAVYNDGGVNTLSGPVTLAGDTVIHSRAGNLAHTGALGQSGGSRSLTKTGEGVLTLSGTANHSGATIVQDGALRVTATAALSSSSNLQLNGGVLEIANDLNGATAGDYSAALGTGGGALNFTGDGGFSAFGGNRTINLGGGSSLTWGAGNFVSSGKALLLSSAHSDSVTTLGNAIDLAGGLREVRVANGTLAVDGVLSGNLTNGGLVKSGDGTLNLTGTGNTYSGATRIDAGALRGNYSTSNIQLNGGVLELSANYTSALGTGVGQIQWTGGGGLAAISGNVTFNAGGAGAALTWGTGGFVAANQTLVLGSASSSGTLAISNEIALGSAARTIRMQNGAADIDAQLNGTLSGSTGSSLRVEGAGTLAFSRDESGFNRALTVDGAEFRMVGSADLNSMTSLTVQGGGVFKIDNGTTDDGTRLGNALPLTLNAGSFNYQGRSNGASSETIGSLTLSGGANSILVAGGGTNSASLTVEDITRGSTSGSTLNLLLGSATSSFVFADAPNLDDGILDYMTVNGTDFATHSGDGTAVVAYTGYGNDINAAGGTTNVSLTGTNSLTSTTSLNALKLGSGASLSLGANTLTVNSGGILTTGASAVTISGGTLTSGNSEMFLHTYNTGGTTISSTLTGNGRTTKSGEGTLTLSGGTSNTRSGTTTVNAGRVDLAKTGGAIAIAGNLIIGDASGIDTVRLLGSEQIVDSADVTLRGGTLLNDNHQAVFDLNGFSETIDAFNITGNSVLDFSGGAPDAPSFLVIDTLSVPVGALLTVRSWIDAADYFLIAKSGMDSVAEQSQLARVVFDGYGPAVWEDYSADYFMITPHARPVPEPAAYGAFLFGGLAGLWLTRRRSRG